MQYVKLGRSGLDVSRICLGCMTYGESGRGKPAWSIDEAASRPLIRQALELGINFLDTANIYSDGSSEEIVGRAIKDFARREDVVLATKLNSRMRPGPNGMGLSRKAIMHEIDMSLRRLGTDYVDLYQIHRFDPATPIEETLEALHDLVKAGKVRYLGASSMFAWQFAKMLYVAQAHGWTRFVSMQNHYNLLNREEEREMLPLCAAEGVGSVPWSPLARGLLARDGDRSSVRAQHDPVTEMLFADSDAIDQPVIEATRAVARERGVPMAQVALAWIMGRSPVVAPIIGASKPRHLEDAVAAVGLALSAQEVARLEGSYVPHRVVGYS